MKSDFNAEQAVTRFKIDLLKKMPFYGDVLAHLPLEADTSIPTACTNGYRIRYNPRFLQSLKGQEEINFVIMHEIMHILLHHATRIGRRNPQIWNVAGDLIINNMLVQHVSADMKRLEIPFQMPKNVLFSYLPSDATTESVYDDQLSRNPQPSKSRRTSPAKITVCIRPERFRPDSMTITISAPTDLQPDQGSPSDVSGAEASLQNILRNAFQKSRASVGSYFIPGEIRASLVSSVKILNWKHLLREHLSSVISDDSSYSTPERKYLHMDLIIPGHGCSEEELEEVWAFVDSSGSISQEELNVFLTQLYHLVKDMNCTLNLCYWDTSVTDVYKKIRNGKDILIHPPKHTGGTDINCVYEWLREKHVRPDVLLILTDGYFGTLRPELSSPSLKRKTILIITNERMAKEPSMKKIGRTASL